MPKNGISILAQRSPNTQPISTVLGLECSVAVPALCYRPINPGLLCEIFLQFEISSMLVGLTHSVTTPAQLSNSQDAPFMASITFSLR